MSILGFGCMRLPVKNDNKIDYDEFERMVDVYLKAGGSYFDTAFGYHKQQSEVALGEVLVRNYPRDMYNIATKLPAWKHTVTNEEQAKNMFYTSLDRLKTDYIDYYLFQNMGEERSICFEKYKLWDFVNDLKKQGLIRKFGVSVHDGPEHIESLLKEHPEIEFIQLQINYADYYSISVKAKECYEMAQKYNKPVIVMEPLKGGTLVHPPEIVQRILGENDTKQNVEKAFRFVNQLEGVQIILSGMSSLQQIKDNIDIFDRIKNVEEDISYMHKASKAFLQIQQIACTSCNYCLDGCQKKVKISKIMTAMNFEKIYHNRHMAEHYYYSNVFLEGKASECIRCGICEKVCPQGLKIREYLKEAEEYFGE